MDIDKLRTWSLLATVYLLAIFSPLIVSDPVTPPVPLFWVFVGIGFTVITYGSVLSWRRGDKRPLVVRTLIPLGLLGVSLTLFWTGVWSRMLVSMHSGHRW
jgi:hypothetical protein